MLILASGRPTQGLIEYAKQLDMHKNNGLLVSFNGAEVVNVQTHEVLYKKQMSANDAKAVLKHIENFNVKAIIDKDDYMYVKDVYDWNIKTKEGYKNMLQYLHKDYSFLFQNLLLQQFYNFLVFFLVFLIFLHTTY